MNWWVLLQGALNIFLVLGLVALWRKIEMKKHQDDPRLSRGLQLLQSKIAILEDLSDRTDVQVKQLGALMERKTLEVQEQIIEAERHVQEIRHSTEKSLEVAKIFEDKIPHHEIIERQNTSKYVRAAIMANRGVSLDEIAQQVDIPRGELEFLVKVNRENLMFSEEQLPEWAKPQVDFSSAFETPKVNHVALEKLGERFREAVVGAEPETPPQIEMPAPVQAPVRSDSLPLTASSSAGVGIRGAPQIRPVQFKKISLNDSLG